MNLLERYTIYKKDSLINLSGVYCIENITNNKKYIGESKYLERRLLEHIRKLLKNSHVNYHLQNAVNLYGIDNFKIFILEICESKDTKIREYFWANYYNSEDKNFGYNIKKTDPDKINMHSRETIEKIIETKRKKAAERGYWVSKETTEQIFKTRKENAEQRGYWHSEETKINIGKGRKGKGIKPDLLRKTKKKMTEVERKEYYEKRKGITFITPEGRASISKANKGKIMPIETREKIRNSNIGLKRSEETIEKMRQSRIGKTMTINNRLKINEAIEKKVIQYTLDDIEVNRFNNIVTASSFTNINGSSIGAVCSNKRKTAGNFKWKFLKDEIV